MRDAALIARLGRSLKMEPGEMMVFGAAIVAMTVFLVTLFVVAQMTERRAQ
jgi:hypothetical protein